MKSKWLNFDNAEYQYFRYKESVNAEKIKQHDENQPVVNFSFLGNDFIISTEKITLTLIVENFTQETMLNKIRQYQDSTILKIQHIDNVHVFLEVFIFSHKLIFPA